jgi:hypothetical protein
MDILFLVIYEAVIFAGGCYLGYEWCKRKMLRELSELVMENIIQLTHEVQDGQHYLYYKDDGKFAGQGASLEEAAERFSLLNKGNVGHVIPSTGVEFFIVDGKIEQTDE